MKNIKLFVTFVASLFFLFSCEKEKVETCGFGAIANNTAIAMLAFNKMFCFFVMFFSLLFF